MIISKPDESVLPQIKYITYQSLRLYNYGCSLIRGHRLRGVKYTSDNLLSDLRLSKHYSVNNDYVVQRLLRMITLHDNVPYMRGRYYRAIYERRHLRIKRDRQVIIYPNGVDTIIDIPESICPGHIERLVILSNPFRFLWVTYDINPMLMLAIDHGVSNWLTCVSNVGTSFIIDGKQLVGYSHGSSKPWSSIKQDAINRAARLVINKCVDNGIGTIVFGWDPNTSNTTLNPLGKELPTMELKDRIRQYAIEYSINFHETEESHTSRASALDGDTVPQSRLKPSDWNPSGIRLKRGLYKTANGIEINADVNAAWNIGAKVASKLNTPFNASLVNKGVFTSPKRIKLWD